MVGRRRAPTPRRRPKVGRRLVAGARPVVCGVLTSVRPSSPAPRQDPRRSAVPLPAGSHRGGTALRAWRRGRRPRALHLPDARCVQHECPQWPTCWRCAEYPNPQLLAATSLAPNAASPGYPLGIAACDRCLCARRQRLGSALDGPRLARVLLKSCTWSRTRPAPFHAFAAIARLPSGPRPCTPSWLHGSRWCSLAWA